MAEAASTMSVAAGFPGSLSMAAALPAASGPLSSLQTGMNAASALTSLFSGVAGRSSNYNRASFMDMNASQDRLAAEAAAIEIERERVKRVGETRVAFAASGQLTSSGADIERALADDAARKTSLTRASGDATAAGRRAQAASLRSQGDADLLTGSVKAWSTWANNDLSLRRRG